MNRKIRLLIIGLVLGIKMGFAQSPDSVLQVVYLIGNTATPDIPAGHLQAFKTEIQSQPDAFTIIHLGDILSNTGLADTKTQSTAKLDQLLDLARGKPRGQIFFIPGDKDWDNGGPEGLKKVRQLEAYLASRQPNSRLLLPGKGCPGPEVIDVGSGLRIIALNTPWWMHPYRKPVEPDTDCDILSKPEMMEALEEAVSEAGGRNILLVGHHPVYSNGVYGGRMPLKKHLFPFSDANPNNRVPLPGLGSLYAAYRQNVGTHRDMAHPLYQDFKNQMDRFLKLNSEVVYASAHDYSLQLTKTGDNYQLVSGAFAAKDFVGRHRGSQFNQTAAGFAKVTYYANGQVTARFYTFGETTARPEYTGVLFQSACNEVIEKDIPVNSQVGACLAAAASPGMPAKVAGEVTTAVAGPEYAAGPFKEKFLGKLYRSSWTQPVQVPYLFLSQTPARLRPYKIGGGRQTTSVRLRAADGQEYVFRSVHKDPVGALPPELRNTVVVQVLRDFMATEQPYAAMPVSRLLDATDILHARPTLYVLGDDPALGIFRTRYAGLFGMLEVRPQDPHNGKPGFAGADDIKNTYNFFRSLYKDHDARIDARSYGQARAFDMFIGDWGRHPDNWRWAGYRQGKTTLYRPIPRDRDHAFSRWDGLIPWLADREWAVPNIQNFDTRFGGLQSLTWPARHLDRALLTALSRQDWRDIATTLQGQMTDPVIDQALTAFPPEIASRQGAEIGRTLKVRREKLPAVLDSYYDLLARYADVVGSNKNEYFKVERLPDDGMRVQVYEKDKASGGPEGEPYFDRTFLKTETKELRLYGLGGGDVFVVNGEAASSIRLRIIGGTGGDSIYENPAARSVRKKIFIYDNSDTKLALGGTSRNHTADVPGINSYDRQAFEYNSYNPSGGLLYNRSDGLGIAAGINYQRQRFRKPGYGSLYGFHIRATQNGNLQFTSNLLWRQAMGKIDVGAFVDAGRYFRYYNFFGLGNNTVKEDARFDDNYYKARYGGLITHVFLQKAFFQRSHFRLGPTFETLQTDFDNSTFLGESPEGRYNTADQQLAGLRVELNLDLRDKAVFTQRGIRVFVRHNSYKRLENGLKGFGLTEGYLDYYGSVRLLLPITLGLRLGGASNYGRDLPFYKYASLGMQQNLRGYVISRFSGDATAYLNTELRFHLGQVNNAFLPFHYGLLAFYDRAQAWYRGDAPGGWHTGYGGGFYLAPIAERFVFSALLQRSREENLLLQVGAGFRFDQ